MGQLYLHIAVLKLFTRKNKMNKRLIENWKRIINETASLEKLNEDTYFDMTAEEAKRRLPHRLGFPYGTAIASVIGHGTNWTVKLLLPSARDDGQDYDEDPWMIEAQKTMDSIIDDLGLPRDEFEFVLKEIDNYDNVYKLVPKHEVSKLMKKYFIDETTKLHEMSRKLKLDTDKEDWKKNHRRGHYVLRRFDILENEYRRLYGRGDFDEFLDKNGGYTRMEIEQPSGRFYRRQY